MQQQALKLSEFLELIKTTIDLSFGYEGFWIIAELSEWRKSGSHYYGELIEHDGISKFPIAKIRCNCWANKAYYINDKFSLATGEKLSADIKVLVKVTVNYHISFGLSLNIIDIEPSFTLGDRQARKIQILEELAKKGILENNKSLSLPDDFTSIAVITSISAAGKGDFFEEADKLANLGLCKFDIYEAKMQGEECATSVAEAFKKIAKRSDDYDAIVLIRGGGSQADLDWFNNLLPAESICNSKIPVMVGIGHERDTTVLDDICTKRFDTPSKVINFIVNTIITQAQNAQSNYEDILKITANLVKQNQNQLDNLYQNLKIKAQHYLHQIDSTTDNNYKSAVSISRGLLKLYKQSVDMNYDNIMINSQNLIKRSQHNIQEQYNQLLNMAKSIIKYYNQASEYLYKQILSVSIEPTLKRGFSITTTDDGKYITSQRQAKEQNILKVMYADGQIKVKVIDNDKTE